MLRLSLRHCLVFATVLGFASAALAQGAPATPPPATPGAGQGAGPGAGAGPGMKKGAGAGMKKGAGMGGKPIGPGFHEVALPTSAGAGDGKEVKELIDLPHLKLATITLRKGTKLEEHAAPMPVTIQVLAGSGSLVMADKTVKLDREHMVVVAPNVKHAVEPDAGGDLVLLVHHVKRPGPGMMKGMKGAGGAAGATGATPPTP